MKDFPLMQSLVGESLKESDLETVDCYIHKKMGLFIPSTGKCKYAERDFHTHPSYMVVIMFSLDDLDFTPAVELKRSHYLATVTSPGVPHCDVAEGFTHYYSVLFDPAYFEEQFGLYTADAPDFNMKQFPLCSDILKALNTFAFEYSKNMQNSDITLDSQATIITHWVIRSILGENLDLRPVSTEYSVARAQHYIEQHFSDEISVEQLAELGHISVSGFNRAFKKEMYTTPIEYLIGVRVEKAKVLLRRKDIPITEVAARCGFGSSAHFSTSFKRLTNVTPSEYRNAYEG